MQMANEFYRRVCLGGFQTKGILVPEAEAFSQVKDFEKPAFISVFKYNTEQYKLFQKNKSVKGIDDVVTNSLVWDLDSAQNISLAQVDAQTLVTRLKRELEDSSIQVYFSGNKGFTVQVDLEDNITPAELKHICINWFGKDLKTLDRSIYNASRILRIPFTRHENGLYKIPLSLEDLKIMSSDDIQKHAKSLDNVVEFDYTTQPVQNVWRIPTAIILDKKPVPIITEIPEKPGNWKACKWHINCGSFSEGERHQALMVLAATWRGMGYPKDQVYYNCKSALKAQAARTGQEEFSKDELYNNIVDSVFEDWNGGTYSCKSDAWLKGYCEGLGENGCQGKNDDEGCIEFSQMTEIFTKYAKDFDKNVIKTGIGNLDDNLTLVCSTLNGLLGQPGAGKTSIASQILRNNSLNDVHSVFFSMDMGLPVVYGKLLQRENGKDFKENLRLVKVGDKSIIPIMESVDKDYKNVSFCYQSSITVQDMKKIIKQRQETTGNPIKLVVVDYLECIAGPFSESTANTGFIANQLKDLANELNVCVLLLLQTQKHSTPDISDPLLTMKGIKGSSLIEQSARTVTTLWREGYNPDTMNNDKYLSMGIVKNTFGPLWKGDFSWNGQKGIVSPLTDTQEYELRKFKEEKKEKKAEQNNFGGGFI